MRWLLRRALAIAAAHAAFLSSSKVTALECSSTCGTPSSLAFCSQVSFGVCGGDASWVQLDAVASEGFRLWANASTTPLRRLPQYAGLDVEQLDGMIQVLGLANTSSACGRFLQRLECAVRFPVCEIGREFSHVCLGSCDDATKKQCAALSKVCELFSSDEIESNGGKCFKFDYNGPAVGMWIAGFTISLVFSILNSIGINLQKLSMSRNDSAEIKKSMFHQPLWMLGLGLTALGSLLDFVAFGMAPQTLLAPLAALSLVWNMFIAPLFHHEKVTRNNITATIIIFAGVTLTVIFSGHNTPSYELEDLIRLYNHTAMYLYMIFVASFLVSLYRFARYIERTHIYEGGLYHIMCYGGMAGTFGGQSVLLAKSTVELLKTAIWGDVGSRVFGHFAPYAIIAALATCLTFQVKFLNGGLARFDALVVIPVYQSFWILMSVLGGIIYFQEYVSMTHSSMWFFTIGGIITILGIVYLLKTRQLSENNGESYIELQGLTPSSAWAADDSDEEEVVQLKPNKAREHVIDLRGTTKPSAVSPSTSSSSPAALSPPSRGFAHPTAAAVASAIYRTPTPTSSPRALSKSKDDDDGFL